VNKPLDQRPSYRANPSHPLVKALHDLAIAHGLRGAVLISFTGDRVAVNSCGDQALFARAMEELGDRILAKIDDGELDPTVAFR
jgi:hypothetical protein